MRKVMKSDGSLANAYAEINSLGLDLNINERWISFTVGFTEDQLVSWNATGSGFGSGIFVFATFAGFSAWLDVDGWKLEGNVTDATGGTPTAGSTLLCEVHLAPALTELYIAGVLVCTVADGISSLERVRFGQISAPNPSVAYIGGVKIGISRRGSQDFSDDFSSGDFSAWSTTDGAVTVVDDPFVTGIQIEVAPGIEAPTYHEVPESPVGVTTDATRKRFTVSRDSHGISAKFTQITPSSKTEIYTIEFVYRPFFVGDGQ